LNFLTIRQNSPLPSIIPFPVIAMLVLFLAYKLQVEESIHSALANMDFSLVGGQYEKEHLSN
jgi:hypothetical protein